MSRIIVSIILVLAFLSSALPCGPGYISPLFDTTSAPENPYADYAAGELGIIKPTFRRSVLFAAYRYIAGGGLSPAEQQAVVEVWKAEIDNKDFRDDSVDEVVKTWVEKRKDIVGKEDKTPDIYAERAYGGYDFFPNCTKSSFETAAETLSDRTSSHGPSDPNVLNWVHAQDQVFQNCASGKQTPDDVTPGAPEWLQKDRAYQRAAAEFYSLDYDAAKRHFAEIAQDPDSPWQETADYLVARTLIRQASLSKSDEKTAQFYDEAEAQLQRFVNRSGKFSRSSEGLMGLIKYRRHPKERVSELARLLTFYGGNENFRQDLIDYNWLLDKFENEVLTAEAKRKEAEKPKDTDSNAVANTAANAVANISNTDSDPRETDDGLLLITLYTADYSNSWKIYVKNDATDDEALAEAEKVVGQPLTDTQKDQVRNLRKSAYVGRFSSGSPSIYEGGYWGEERMTPSLMPDFLRQDEVTSWLFIYQMKGAEAYLYSLITIQIDRLRPLADDCPLEGREKRDRPRPTYRGR